MNEELYSAAIASNNEGARQLRRGNLRHANALFVESLNMMTQATTLDERTSSPYSITLRWHEISPETKRLSCSDSSTSKPFVYSRAVMVEHRGFIAARPPPSAHSTTDENVAQDMDNDQKTARESMLSCSCQVESAAILFNLGLSNHLMGSNALHSEMLLQKAVRFYKIATTLLRRAVLISETQEHNKDLIILELAMVSNMGQIYYDFARYKSSDLCFRLLARRLNASLRVHQGNLQEALDPITYQGLVLNASIKSPSLAAAA